MQDHNPFINPSAVIFVLIKILSLLINQKLQCIHHTLDATVIFEIFISGKYFLNRKLVFLGFHGVALVKTFPLMYQLLM